MRCCVTQSVYSRGEDFSSADVIVDDLDHGTDGPITMTYLNCKLLRLIFEFITDEMIILNKIIYESTTWLSLKCYKYDYMNTYYLLLLSDGTQCR
jgi:hypothetical protein